MRLALLALSRAPTRTAAAGAFLVVTIGLVVFAAAYRSTLERGVRDQAAFSVPLDVTVSAGSALVQPLDVAPRSRNDELAPGARAHAVLRTTADAAGVGTAVQSATVLGVPSAALATMHWRGDYSGTSRSRLARELGRDSGLTLAGVPLPAGARGVRLGTRLRGAALSLELVLRDRHGRIERLALGTARPGVSTLERGLPPRLQSAAPLELLGLELSLSRSGRAWLLHLAREGRVVRAPSGTVSLEPLVVRARGSERPVTGWRRWVNRGAGAEPVAPDGEGARIAYAFPEVETLLLRPRQPTDGRPLRVVASPAVASAAGPDGNLTLNFYDSVVGARVVGTARRFPTVGPEEEFVVVEGAALSTALDAGAPGSGAPGELWLSVPDGQAAVLERALDRPPFTSLERVSRARLQAAGEGDPLARGIVYTLGAAALVALVLAVVGLWATLLSDLRDERDTFFDLEAQGAGPETLRRQARIRGLALLVFGVAGGIVLGVILSRLVVSVVQVTAAATTPEPPLVLDAGSGAVAVVLAVLLAAAIVAIELTVRQAFRGDVPERASWSLE